MAETGCDALDLDWTTDLKDARARVGHKVALQGNMDLAVLYARPSASAPRSVPSSKTTAKAPASCFNLGTAFTSISIRTRSRCRVESVHEQSKKYHA